MKCALACSLAAGLAGSAASMTVKKFLQGSDSALVPLLDEAQLRRYGAIVRERLSHAHTGYAAGLVVAFAVCSSRHGDACQLSTLLECEYVAIVLGVANLVYMLLPKSDYMAYHLTTPAQMRAWMDVYRRCQGTSVMGFVIGLGAYHVLASRLAD